MHIFPSIPEEDFEGYIFDCDGTLAHSMPMHFESWRYALNKNGAQFDFTWELFYSMAGMGIHYSVERLNKEFDHKLDPNSLILDIKAFVYENLYRVEPIKEVVEVARKFSLVRATSVASGGPRVIVDRILEIIKAKDIFQHIVTQDDVVNSKPHPEMFLYAAKKMGVNPKKCLVFEDSLLGIEAAKSAGMKYVLIKSSKPENIAKILN